ncbi:malate dehydrogenase (oxaloacetate-decarboxylating) [Alkalibacterium subtropicum]|uniref:Malate dehydrogenase (Oxaloacetate-decarboxylating) n=1 Tax=Alkalibacterium subtropicum TaxID=753702 RepID=A0A1I1G0N4_9LACT|nr:NAD-dependent malic enzyme [Alkalibacterium subtropicum]SFC05389.1 malate dehydrogenase (oxaloacetate-decarboxylating) [Alkalibacterium subtropicum]
MINIKLTEVLNNPYINKGTAFTEQEREVFSLEGRLPPAIQTIDEQSDNFLRKLSGMGTDYDKHRYLMNLYADNRTLFFYIVENNIKKLLPIIYTPTIAEAVKHFSKDNDQARDAVYISTAKPDKIKSALENSTKNLSVIKLMVITDGEGVLGMGDWGINGAAISIGKLAVYTVAAGLNPQEVLPVVIDAGTNNEELLNDTYYLGNRQKRISGEPYLKFIDQFISIASELFPNVLFHWEDFGIRHAQLILDKYRDKLCTFNDDIQGTGIMMVSALNSVEKITQKKLTDHTIMIFGAGTAGIGIADLILAELKDKGMPEEEAKQRIYLYDRHGIVHSEMKGATAGQQRYAQAKDRFERLPDTLEEAVEAVKPTILIGSSGQSGAFSKDVVEHMHKYTERPAIFPISNPASLAEAKAVDIVNWTKGKGLVVTGSPSEPVEYEGVTYVIGQANNALLYPGLGLGLVTAQAKRVTDSVLLSAAHAVNDIQDLSEEGTALLPDVSRLREVSDRVAEAVINKVIEENLNQVDISDSAEAVRQNSWEAVYRPL